MNGRMWAVDVEGNGRTPSEIVEVAIVELQGLEPTGLNRTWRVRPAGGISAIAARIHGIWERDVSDAPELDDVADDILDWLEGVPIVGHNVRVEVDILSRSLGDWSPPAAYDTLKLARMLLPDAPRHGLQKVGEMLGLDALAEIATGSAAHSALYDATLSAMLLGHLLGPVPEEERSRLLAQIDILPVEQARLL